MPKKSVREMGILERMHYSLGAKTFHAVIRLAVIISAVAIAFGFYLYASSVRREYRIMTWNISKMAAHALDPKEVQREADAVLDIYASLSPEEQADDGSAAYLQRYDSVRDVKFEAMRELIHEMQVENDAIAGYIAAMDEENNRMVFITDGDPNETFCPPGTWDELKEKNVQALIYGSKVSLMDRFYGAGSMPSVMINLEKYGYRCTAGTKLTESNGYPVMIFYDTDMNRVAGVSRTFLLHYVLVLLAAAFIAGFLMTRHLKKTVVQPINQLAEAAYAYTVDKKNEHRTGKHFESLDIRTGDEIENLSLTMKDMENDLADYVQNLTRVTAEKERINTELSVASQIQEGMIPHIYPAFPDRPEFDVYAAMHPAKEVGGDFYDFFLIDGDHLAVVMADVSGKGIPAALFMMASKILIGNIAKIPGMTPARILASVNEQICENNPAEMFVTVWLGILEISTGKLLAANAGHEYPAVRKAGGGFRLFKDKHGFIVGGMENMVYTDYQIDLAPGDIIFQYTDGVTEAENAAGEHFGTDRMIEALNSEESAEPERILQNMTETIRAFAGSAEQFDDVTMLCLMYRGKQREHE